jgi:hypothetical protein
MGACRDLHAHENQLADKEKAGHVRMQWRVKLGAEKTQTTGEPEHAARVKCHTLWQAKKQSAGDTCLAHCITIFSSHIHSHAFDLLHLFPFVAVVAHTQHDAWRDTAHDVPVRSASPYPRHAAAIDSLLCARGEPLQQLL